VILIAERLGVRPQPYLIAVATAANIGSAATLIGNPQNMIIGIESQMPFLDYTARVAPIVLVGLVANVVLVRNAFPADFMGGFTLRAPLPDLPFRGGLVARALVTLAAVLAGFSLGWSYPLVAITGATALILAGDVDPHRVISKVDWPLLLFFGGLFVVMGGVAQSGLSDAFFGYVRPWLEKTRGDQLAGLLGGVTVLSNVISNVPAVLLFTPILKAHGTPDTWTMLALTATFAGNLTLLGSVANLIVAGIARRSGHSIGFWEFLKVGVPLTLFTLMTAYTLLRIG
jgi:Na+/H+ antiporter NhaD/arsenite permease-like protein